MMDGLNVVSKISLYERIADLLEERILSDGYEIEKKLPSEQALAEQYSVSRTVIREALKLLKERGLVDSRNGMGSYVTKPEAGNLADVIYRMAVLDKISYAEIYDVRKILEIAACREAASSVRNDQLAEMNAYLEELKDRSISVKERIPSNSWRTKVKSHSPSRIHPMIFQIRKSRCGFLYRLSSYSQR